MLKCKDLIPSYLTEIFFCLFVIFHVFVEGKSKETEKVRNSSQMVQGSTQNEGPCLSEGLTGCTNSLHNSQRQQLFRVNLSLSSIPVYIVKDADCMGHNKDKLEEDNDALGMTSPS